MTTTPEPFTTYGVGGTRIVAGRWGDPRTILADDIPMLLVRGQMSDLVSQERADQFLARFPRVEFVDVCGAGHMIAGDRNDLFADAVLDFLIRHPNGG